MNEEVKKHDKRGNLIYEKCHLHFGTRFGTVDTFIEHWYKYDDKNNWVYVKTSDEFEVWEVWYEYDSDGNKINITEQKIEEIEFLDRKKISRFELMEL